MLMLYLNTVKPVLSVHLKRRQKIGCSDLVSLKLPFVIKIFVFSIFEWPLKTGFTVYKKI